MTQEIDIETIIEVEIEVETEVEIEAEIEESRNNSRDRGRSNSRESRNDQQRSGSGQRYFGKKDFCDHCNRIGHPTLAQAVQDDLNTKLNSLKLSNSTNN